MPDLHVRPPLKIRGVLPVVISSRKPAPLVIPLVDAAGKTFRQGVSVVRFDKVSTTDANATAVNFFVSEDVGPADRTRVSAGPEKDFVGDYFRDRIDFEDADGHPLSWLILGDHPASTTNRELSVQTFVGGNVPPARLRVYRLRRLATEIPFELGDVPSP